MLVAKAADDATADAAAANADAVLSIALVFPNCPLPCLVFKGI